MFIKNSWIKKIILSLAVMAGLFLSFNAAYFKKVGDYLFKDKTQIYQSAIPTSKFQKGKPDLLTISKLGISAPVVYASSVDESLFQTLLKDGVVHYPNTANPGELGNCYIFGHSSDYPWSKGSYKAVFATLPYINIGDTLAITNHQGSQFTYRVINTKVVSPQDVSVLSQYGSTNRLLTLQTSYPLGTALKRFIVVAEME